MHKLSKLNSSIDIIPLQGTSEISVKTMRSAVDHTVSRDPRCPRDPLIISRVQKFMYENEDKIYIDVNEMADSLQKRYRDYHTRKRSAFRNMVRRAYDEITENFSKKSDCSADDDDEQVEIESDSQNDLLSKEFIKFYKKNIDSQNGNSSDKELIDISSDDENDKHCTENVKKRREDDHLMKKTISPPKDIVSQSAVASEVEDMTSGPSSAQPRKEKNAHPETEVKTKKRTRDKEDDGNAVTKRKKSTTARSIEAKIKFSDVGGNTKVLETVCRLLVHIRHPEIFKQLGISSPRGFLLHGPPGCGKTLLAHAIAGELGVPLIKVAAPELIAGVSGESESRIREMFEQALAMAPCVLFLDEVDAIATHRATAQKEMERRIVAQLLSCLDDLGTKENGETVLVLGATNRPEALDPALRRAGRFDREISLGIPDKEARKSILAIRAAKLKLADDVNFADIAALTPGFVGADLVALLTEAAMAAVNRVFDLLRNEGQAKPSDIESVSEVREADEVLVENGMEGCSTEAESGKEIINGDEASPEKTPDIQEDSSGVVKVIEPESTTVTVTETQIPKPNDSDKLTGLLTWLRNDAPLSPERLANLQIERCDFENALKVVQPSSKREGFATVPDVTWDDIGSLQNIRQELQMAILAPVRHSERFEAFGLSAPTGVMLCGPPGCGKTLLAKAIANEAGINFISVKGPELLNMYVGESEKAVRQCFIRARNSAPCVIFFDELDALCPKRSDGDNSSTSRVVNQMLTEMDGVEGRKGVYLMAASNRPDMIDPAVLRPGRLDKILYVGLPTAADRVDILKALTKNGTKPRFEASVDLEEVAKSANCDGYSGADLSALVREAATEALRESMSDNLEESTGVTEVSIRHITVAFDKVKPSVHEKDAKHYDTLQKKYSPTRKSPEIIPMDTPVDAPMIDAVMEAMET
ncbi:nuclear valosin-containing protein-like [Venturia canescens]|uniref:nuclear valosin-containing protein-like n=1 Tax=Venturia canescens TaxID=32260 RepID=UPI001C9CBB59|nr:nuclear valosin-containing protein-like [Venturia canescens]